MSEQEKVEEFKLILSKVKGNLPPKIILNLIDDVHSTLKCELPVSCFDGDCLVCGDLHGDFDTLCEVIDKFFDSNKKGLISLGDYVDKGQNSIQVLLLILFMKQLFPRQVIVLRGNHECPSTKKLTSQNEWRRTKLGRKLISLFIDIPLVCVINQKILCLHGGLPDIYLRNLNSKSILPETIGHQVVWNDFIIEGENKNLQGNPFNEDDFHRFCVMNQVKTIIRGHQYVKEGYAEFVPGLITLSTTRYKSKCNLAGIVIIENEMIVPMLL
jgi:predicted phosphodiesterase